MALAFSGALIAMLTTLVIERRGIRHLTLSS
jgi:hypothetical protein